MPYMLKTETTKCPNPVCGSPREYTRTTYQEGCGGPVWSVDEDRYCDCPDCGVDLEDLFQTVAAYRVAREAYLAADAAADASFKRWFEKRRDGIATNGAQATRLANETNFKSADLSGAELRVWQHEISPRDVDAADGCDELVDRAV